jgi:sarcosine oxidase
MPDPRAEVAVIGAGVVGLATAVALADAGVDVRCFERAEPGAAGSAGLTRIFRHLHGTAEMVALSVRSRAGWAEWERRARRRLVGDEGLLALHEHPERALALLADAGVPGRLLDAEGQSATLPALRSGASRAILDPGGGAIRVRRTVDLLASWLGPRLVREEVLGVHPDGDGAVVHAATDLWRCRRVVLCSGARTPELARALGLELPVSVATHLRATFAVHPSCRSAPLACWIDHVGTSGERVYGGPLGSSGRYALGLAEHGADAPTAPGGPVMAGGADLRPAAERLSRYVARAFPGLDPEPVAFRLCAASTLPWERDAVAAWRAGPVVAVAGANLFKHAPSLGALLAAAALEDRVPVELAPAVS